MQNQLTKSLIAFFVADQRQYNDKIQKHQYSIPIDRDFCLPLWVKFIE